MEQDRSGLRVCIRIGRWGMGRCVWRGVCRGDTGNVDFAGITVMIAHIVKIIPSIYKPKIWGGCSFSDSIDIIRLYTCSFLCVVLK